jgi:hypothetical protein
MGEYFLTTEKFLETYTDMGLRDEYYLRTRKRSFDSPNNLRFICDCKILGQACVKLSNDAKYIIDTDMKTGQQVKRLCDLTQNEKISFNVDRILAAQHLQTKKIHGEN